MQDERQQVEPVEASKAEGQAEPTVSELMAQVEALKSTNDRLLSQSKENSDKYRAIRDKNAAREKMELEQAENWKERLELEKNEKLEFKEKFENLKTTALKKDLNFEVAKMVSGQPLQEGVSMDDVIYQVMETGLIEVNESENGFNNLQEAFEKVKESKRFLFDHGKKPMINTVPNSSAPKEKQLSKDELFRRAIGAIHKK